MTDAVTQAGSGGRADADCEEAPGQVTPVSEQWRMAGDGAQSAMGHQRPLPVATG